MTTTYEIEKELTSETGHGHGCWEVFAEKMVEDGKAVAGNYHDEIKDAKGKTITLWMAYEEYLTNGGCEWQDGCPGTEYTGEE